MTSITPHKGFNGQEKCWQAMRSKENEKGGSKISPVTEGDLDMVREKDEKENAQDTRKRKPDYGE